VRQGDAHRVTVQGAEHRLRLAGKRGFGLGHGGTLAWPASEPIKAHPRRWRPRSRGQRTGSTPPARSSGAALRLDPSRLASSLSPQTPSEPTRAHPRRWRPRPDGQRTGVRLPPGSRAPPSAGPFSSDSRRRLRSDLVDDARPEAQIIVRECPPP
jgi:hypothetical protein